MIFSLQRYMMNFAPEGYESDLSLNDVYFLWDDIDANYLDEPTFGPLKYKEFYSNIKVVDELGFM